MFQTTNQVWFLQDIVDGCKILQQLTHGLSNFPIGFQPFFWGGGAGFRDSIHSIYIVGPPFMKSRSWRTELQGFYCEITLMTHNYTQWVL